MNDEKYIALDVHQATISAAVMDATGKVVMQSILETKAATILEFFAGLRGTLCGAPPAQTGTRTSLDMATRQLPVTVSQHRLAERGEGPIQVIENFKQIEQPGHP